MRARRHHRRPRHTIAGSDCDSSSTSAADTASASLTSVSSSSGGSNRHRQNDNNNRRHPRQVQCYNVEQYVAMDCEMVGVGEYGKCSSLARVTLIDWHGETLMDEFVQQTEEVTDYRTFVSGITQGILSQQANMDLPACRRQVLSLLDGKILVGHGLKNDLRALGITHPWYMMRDTAKYQPFMKARFEDGILWPKSLKDLCHEHLNRDIQVHGIPHCPHEDALAALDLYRHVMNKWEKVMDYKLTKTRAIEQQQVQSRNTSISGALSTK